MNLNILITLLLVSTSFGLLEHHPKYNQLLVVNSQNFDEAISSFKNVFILFYFTDITRHDHVNSFNATKTDFDFRYPRAKNYSLMICDGDIPANYQILVKYQINTNKQLSAFAFFKQKKFINFYKLPLYSEWKVFVVPLITVKAVQINYYEYIDLKNQPNRRGVIFHGSKSSPQWPTYQFACDSDHQLTYYYTDDVQDIVPGTVQVFRTFAPSVFLEKYDYQSLRNFIFDSEEPDVVHGAPKNYLYERSIFYARDLLAVCVSTNKAKIVEEVDKALKAYKQKTKVPRKALFIQQDQMYFDKYCTKNIGVDLQWKQSLNLVVHGYYKYAKQIPQDQITAEIITEFFNEVDNNKHQKYRLGQSVPIQRVKKAPKQIEMKPSEN